MFNRDLHPSLIAAMNRARQNLPLMVTAMERAKKNGWYSMTNEGKGEADVYIYDVIGADFWGDGVAAGPFVKDLKAIKADLIHLRVNSPGGSVFDALAIAQALDEHPATIWTHIDGIGASAASWVGLRSEKTIMAPKSRLFIHDPLAIVLGNADDMRREAEVLDSIGDDIADLYADKAKGSRQEWRSKMLTEMWFSDQEAVDAGLADEIAGQSKPNNRWDLSILAIYKDTPADLLRRGAGNGGMPSKRDAEQALRDAGLPASRAKAVLAGGWNASDEDPQEAAALASLLSTIRSAAGG